MAPAISIDRMTPQQFKNLRLEKLGLSAQKCAQLLGVGSGRTVRRWETDGGDVPRSARSCILAHVRINELEGTMMKVRFDRRPALGPQMFAGQERVLKILEDLEGSESASEVLAQALRDTSMAAMEVALERAIYVVEWQGFANFGDRAQAAKTAAKIRALTEAAPEM